MGPSRTPPWLASQRSIVNTRSHSNSTLILSGFDKFLPSGIGSCGEWDDEILNVPCSGILWKDLDVAIVKATNHVECPPKERHVRSKSLVTVNRIHFKGSSYLMVISPVKYDDHGH